MLCVETSEIFKIPHRPSQLLMASKNLKECCPTRFLAQGRKKTLLKKWVCLLPYGFKTLMRFIKPTKYTKNKITRSSIGMNQKGQRPFIAKQEDWALTKSLTSICTSETCTRYNMYYETATALYADIYKDVQICTYIGHIHTYIHT